MERPAACATPGALSADPPGGDGGLGHAVCPLITTPCMHTPAMQHLS